MTQQTKPVVKITVDLDRVRQLAPDDKPWLVDGGWPGPTIVYVVAPRPNDPPQVTTLVAGMNGVAIEAVKEH